MKILSIIGARPQFVKAAVFRRCCDENNIDEILLHTGQHYDPEMSTKIFGELDVRQPDITNTISARSHGAMTGEILTKVEQAIKNTAPDFVNVYGDTNSTLAGALAASKLHVPVIHIEAGLRSYDKRMPEEINRIATDHVSDFLFCPTIDAVKNLKLENITNGVHHVGDIMYDAVKMFDQKFYLPPELNRKSDKPLAVMTVHRADATANPSFLKEIIDFCEKYSSDYQIIFPCHPNTRSKLTEFSLDIGQIELIDPVPYLAMQGLLKEAQLVLTDSGGLQKEAYFHRCDCITLRAQTEWIETVESGWNRLWKEKKKFPKKAIEAYGDGNVAEKIIGIISS